jgi:hypothetical protein
LRKLILVGALTLLATPYLASAREDDDKDDKDRHHGHMNASELAGAGAAAASLIGLAGYVILRRRNARQG